MKDDMALVASALLGGPEMFGPIIERYRDAVFAVALSRLRNFDDAEDIAQEVFIEAFEHLGKLSDPSRLGAWLRAITIHRCIDHLRLRRENIGLEEVAEQLEDNANPQAEAEQKELRAQVMSAIGQLSNKQRETTTLFYINGYSQEEIAKIQEVPIGTVRRRLHDAREKLKEEMIGVVEGVLKSEVPKEDFGKRVFEILSRYGRPATPWGELDEITSELQKIGKAGLEGFTKALSSPHYQTRRFAVRILPALELDQELIIELLKKSLADSNKEVRKTAFRSLAEIMYDDQSRHAELASCLIQLLTDPSWNTRWYVAWWIGEYGIAKYVSLERIVGIFLDEKDSRVRKNLEYLMRAVLNAQEVDKQDSKD